jgi:hypothetical protein
MVRPRAADDFAAIRARMEELRRKREGVPEDARRKTDPKDDPRLANLAQRQLELIRRRGY